MEAKAFKFFSLDDPHVEKFLRSDFVKVIPGEPSKILQGRDQIGGEKFNCPKCDAGAKAPVHGIMDICKNCALHWVSYGNVLYVWRTEET